MASVGCSVARASEARESMIRLSHSIWTAVRGDSWPAIAPMHAVLTATMLTVNCRRHKLSSVHKKEYDMQSGMAAVAAMCDIVHRRDSCKQMHRPPRDPVSVLVPVVPTVGSPKSTHPGTSLPFVQVRQRAMTGQHNVSTYANIPLFIATSNVTSIYCDKIHEWAHPKSRCSVQKSPFLCVVTAHVVPV